MKRIYFTPAWVRALPAPATGRDVYYDEKCRGLQLRVTPTGTKTFCVRRRVRNAKEPERITIGRWPDITVGTARAKADQIIGQIAGAENPAEARRAIKGELTFADLFERYIEDRRKAGKRSVKQMREMWELYLGQLPKEPRRKHSCERVKPPEGVNWANKRLSEITKARIATLHTRIANAGKKATANRVHSLLHSVLEFAVKQELLDANPARHITHVHEQSRTRFLGKDELPKFIAALEQEAQPWRDFFTVALFVGYRRSALAAMRWRDVDLEAGTWAVPGERAKNGDPIVLPITGPALTALLERHRHRESAVWVFPGGSKAGHLTSPQKAWARLMARAKFDNLHMHDLRRTLGSWLAMSGASLPAIGRALGHKDPRSTEVYARWQTAAVATSVSRAHDAMEAAVNNPKVVELPVVKIRKRR